MSDIVIRPFRKRDQRAARNLILAGLAEHFDTLDRTLNPDLADIWNTYVEAGHWFLVADDGQDIVGTGALVRETVARGRLVRLTVRSLNRNQGLGRRLTSALVALGQAARFEQLVVETNDDWQGAIRLYRRCGFEPVARRDGEIHFAMELAAG